MNNNHQINQLPQIEDVDKNKSKLTQDFLKSVVNYDPITGIFTRLNKASSTDKKPKVAGSLRIKQSGKAYLGFYILGKNKFCHRLAFLYMEGYMPDQVDHKNGNGCDNRWENLRVASNTSNCRNQRLRSNNTSGQLGVSWHKHTNQWAIRINVNGKRISLGYTKNLQKAISIRKTAEIKYGYSESHGLERPLFTLSDVKEYLLNNKVKG